MDALLPQEIWRHIVEYVIISSEFHTVWRDLRLVCREMCDTVNAIDSSQGFWKAYCVDIGLQQHAIDHRSWRRTARRQWNPDHCSRQCFTYHARETLRLTQEELKPMGFKPYRYGNGKLYHECILREFYGDIIEQRRKAAHEREVRQQKAYVLRLQKRKAHLQRLVVSEAYIDYCREVLHLDLLDVRQSVSDLFQERDYRKPRYQELVNIMKRLGMAVESVPAYVMHSYLAGCYSMKDVIYIANDSVGSNEFDQWYQEVVAVE